MGLLGGLSVEDVRAVQWDKSNLWEIEIDGIDGVNSFIPANDIELGFNGISNGTINGTSLEFAQTTVHPTLTMSYMDDEELSFTTQLREWQGEIVSEDGLVVLPIELAKRAIIITKLSSLKLGGDKFTIHGYPSGSLSYHGESDGSAGVYSLTFTIIGSDVHI